MIEDKNESASGGRLALVGTLLTHVMLASLTWLSSFPN